MSNPTEDVASAVAQAIQENYPEDGLSLYLKGLVIGGHRREVADKLLDDLALTEDPAVIENILSLFYFLHGTIGKIIAPGIPDPRPENAQWDEPLAEEFDGREERITLPS